MEYCAACKANPHRTCDDTRRDICDQVRTRYIGERPAPKPKPVTRRTPEAAKKPTDQPSLPFQQQSDSSSSSGDQKATE